MRTVCIYCDDLLVFTRDSRAEHLLAVMDSLSCYEEFIPLTVAAVDKESFVLSGFVLGHFQPLFILIEKEPSLRQIFAFFWRRMAVRFNFKMELWSGSWDA